MRKYFRLLRVKHYLKNIIILLPLFFSQSLFERDKLIHLLWGVVSFCLASSAVYIFNDLMDAEKDRLHPKKKMRPIASGEVSKYQAMIYFVGCILLSYAANLQTKHNSAFIFVAVFLVMNILYSIGLKKVAILDISILASGYVLRVQYGGILTDTGISGWLYMVVLSGAFYLGLGKRRDEIGMGGGYCHT